MIFSSMNQPIVLPTLNEWGNDEWRKQAECKGVTTAEFFSDSRVVINRVKSMCKVCPVKKECLEFALNNEIMFGIYGGMTPKERNQAFKHVVINR